MPADTKQCVQLCTTCLGLACSPDMHTEIYCRYSNILTLLTSLFSLPLSGGLQWVVILWKQAPCWCSGTTLVCAAADRQAHVIFSRPVYPWVPLLPHVGIEVSGLISPGDRDRKDRSHNHYGPIYFYGLIMFFVSCHHPNPCCSTHMENLDFWDIKRTCVKWHIQV